MEKEVVYTCPKCGYSMLKSRDESYPGATVYWCRMCKFYAYIDSDKYKFVPVTELIKSKKNT